MKIAICYFGLTRSVKKTYTSHITNIFNILKQLNIDYDVFMHTWKTHRNVVWDTVVDIPIDYEEYKLLNPRYYQLDDQLPFLNHISENFSKYYYEHEKQIEWLPSMITNHLCSLESQKRVTDMVHATNTNYDYVMYIRPDVNICTAITLEYFNLNSQEIAIPDFDHHEGYNDRFAIVPFASCKQYGKRIDDIIDFRRSNGRIVGEKYAKYIVMKYFTKVHFIPFIFEIVRP